MKYSHYSVDSKSVIFERFENEVIAIHLERGIYYSLNSTASEIFDLVVAQLSGEAIVQMMESRYTGNPGEVRRETAKFLQRLETEHLVQRAVGDEIAAQPAPDGSTVSRPFVVPQLTAHRDMQDLFLLDPVHDVAEAGWPERRTATE